MMLMLNVSDNLVDYANFCVDLISTLECSWLEKFFFLFSLVTLPMYLLFMYILIRYRNELNSSFFSICISVGVADILYTLFKYCFQSLPKFFWYEEALEDYHLATMAKVGHWGLYFAQIFGTIFVAINRFSALVFPFKYQTMWTRKKLALGMCVQWLLPLPLVAPMLFAMVLLNIDSISADDPLWNTWSKFLSSYNCYYEVELWDYEVATYYLKFALIVEPFLAIIVLALYVAMLINQIKHNKKVGGQQGLTTMFTNKKTNNNAKAAPTAAQQRTWREMKLAAIGFITTVLYSAGVVCIAMSYFGIQVEFAASAYYWFSDLFTSSNPFLLLLFSSKVRSLFKKVLRSLCKCTPYCNSQEQPEF